MERQTFLPPTPTLIPSLWGKIRWGAEADKIISDRAALCGPHYTADGTQSGTALEASGAATGATLSLPKLWDRATGLDKPDTSGGLVFSASGQAVWAGTCDSLEGAEVEASKHVTVLTGGVLPDEPNMFDTPEANGEEGGLYLVSPLQRPIFDALQNAVFSLNPDCLGDINGNLVGQVWTPFCVPKGFTDCWRFTIYPQPIVLPATILANPFSAYIHRVDVGAVKQLKTVHDPLLNLWVWVVEVSFIVWFSDPRVGVWDPDISTCPPNDTPGIGVGTP